MLPAGLVRELELRVGTPTRVRSVGGGCINRAAELDAGGARWFVKWNDDDRLRGMFAAEADGLRRLRAVDTGLAVPEPIAWADAGPETPAWLVMTHLGGESPRGDLGERLGTGLATLHRASGPDFGLERDNFIGSLPQDNRPARGWVDFYGARRLGAQAELAARSGALSVATLALLDRVRVRLPELVPDAPTASLLHGDLWSGNFGVGHGGRPAIFDPAVYRGHREVELAFTELFGGFPRRFYEAYEAAWPLDPGYAERRALYQLYPLLVHANLFGGSYAAQVDAVARRYA